MSRRESDATPSVAPGTAGPGISASAPRRLPKRLATDADGELSGSTTPSRLSRVADACALLTFAIGLLVVAGWLLKIDPIKRVLPGMVAMKFNTALGFGLAGAALWWRKRPAPRIALGSLVALLGALALGEHLAGLDFGIDQLFIRDIAASPEVAYLPGRMAPATALCFLLLGLAAMGSGRAVRQLDPRARSLVGVSGRLGLASEMLALVASVIGGFSLIAYPTGALYLRQLPGSVSMALHTAAAFVVLGTGMLCAAEGIVSQTLRLRGTRVLWIGCGVLTCLLVTVGIVCAVSIQTLAQDVEAQTDVARPRKEATFELENEVLGHVLAVRIARTGDTLARRGASDTAIEVDRHVAEYRALASTDRQRELASRFAAGWQDVRALTTALLNGDGQLTPQESAHLATLRMHLVALVRDEMRAEAVEAFEVRKAATLRDLRTAGNLPLFLLVAGVLLALVTSGAVARAVSKQEQTVREQREWLRVTLSSIGDGVIACDTHRRVTFLNPVAEALTGWKAGEAQGQPLATVLRLVNERTREPAADIAEHVLREGRVVELANHTVLVTRDGREVFIEDSAAPIADDTGTLTGVVFVFHDVTQRRRATDQVKESEARLSRAQEMAHLGSWELDLVKNELTWSDEVYRIFGLEPQQFAATYEAFLAAVHPDDWAAVDAVYAGSVRDGRDSYVIEHRVVRRASGDIRTVHERCLHVRDAEGRIIRSLGMVHDITDRKRAEDALRLSEEKFARAFHGNSSAMSITRLRDGMFIDVNERYLEVTRWTRGEVVGRSSSQLNIWRHPEERDRFVRTLERHGMVRNEEFRFARSGGDEWTALVFAQVSEVGGEQVIISSIVDITERKEAERALRESELRFRLALSNAPVSVAAQDRELRYIWAHNQRTARTDQIVGRRDDEIFTPEEAARVTAIKRRVLDEGVELRDQMWFERPGGRIFLDLFWEPIRDEAGQVVGVASATVDRTPTRLAEEALRDSEERYRLLTDNAVSAVAEHEVVLNAAGQPVDFVFLRANPSFETHTGLRVADILGRRVTEILPGIRETDLIERYGKVALTGEPVSFEQYIQPLERHYLISAYRVGKGRFATAFTDITERKKAEEALATANLHLAESDQRKNEFLAVLSHELRNPLTPIRNGLYLLERAIPGSEQAKRAREVIDRQTKQLARLVDDLLEVTRITRNKIQLQRGPLELNDLVRRSVEDYQSLFDERGIVLESTFAAEPLPINGDAARLSQVVGNLLQNAAKFTPTGGRVVVSTSATGSRERATLSVSDTGVGIQPAMLRRLFQPFMQADATLDRTKGGLGLGLALVKGLVEMHGGEVRAHSNGCDKGAEFVVELPIERTAAAEVKPEAAGRTANRLRVLIIEDNIDAADSLCDVLQLGGYEVEVAYSGAEGLATAREFRPEVVLCDIGLPGMNGYDVARTFRADDELKGVCLVALSGYALPEDVQRATEAGFESHLAKPPSMEKLQALLSAVTPRAADARVDAPLSKA